MHFSRAYVVCYAFYDEKLCILTAFGGKSGYFYAFLHGGELSA
jgi:hypothetical protein